MSITLILFLAASLQVTTQNEDVCGQLGKQIKDGRWTSYDMVVDNCLVRKFIEVGGEEVDFYTVLSNLETLTGREIGLLQGDVDKIRFSSDKSKIKLELEVKAAEKRLARRRLELESNLASERIRASLVESEIRDLMDRCQLEATQIKPTNDCENKSRALFARVGEFCRQLRSKCALLMAETLSKTNST